MAADGTLDFEVTTSAQDLKAALALDSGDEVGIQNLDRVVEVHLREEATAPVHRGLEFCASSWWEYQVARGFAPCVGLVRERDGGHSA